MLLCLAHHPLALKVQTRVLPTGRTEHGGQKREERLWKTSRSYQASLKTMNLSPRMKLTMCIYQGCQSLFRELRQGIQEL